jgi:hypothetical protein
MFRVILLLILAAAVGGQAFGSRGNGNHGNKRQAIASVSLSNSTFTGGAPSGTVVGTISVSMSPATPAFSGTLTLSGGNATSFQIVGTNLETKGVLPAGTYSINLVATEAGTTGSPFTAVVSINGTNPPQAQAITSVSLSSSTFTGGAPSGTVVGTISVSMSPATPAFSGTLTLSGGNAASFQIVGTNLETKGVLQAGTYVINIAATQTGTTGSPFTAVMTIIGLPQTSPGPGPTGSVLRVRLSNWRRARLSSNRPTCRSRFRPALRCAAELTATAPPRPIARHRSRSPTARSPILAGRVARPRLAALARTAVRRSSRWHLSIPAIITVGRNAATIRPV